MRLLLVPSSDPWAKGKFALTWTEGEVGHGAGASIDKEAG